MEGKVAVTPDSYYGSFRDDSRVYGSYKPMSQRPRALGSGIWIRESRNPTLPAFSPTEAAGIWNQNETDLRGQFSPKSQS